METVTDFIFLGSKITADGDCSHEIKTLVLGKKAMINLYTSINNKEMEKDVTIVTLIRKWSNKKKVE